MPAKAKARYSICLPFALAAKETVMSRSLLGVRGGVIAVAALPALWGSPALADRGGFHGGGFHSGGFHGGGFHHDGFHHDGFHHGFHHGFHGAFFFGGFGGFPFWGWPYYGYPYYYPSYVAAGYPYPYPAYAYPPPPPGGAPAGVGGSWYYCEPAKAFYPYVSSCTEPWRQVPAAPPQ
jgi:hypothetical protein